MPAPDTGRLQRGRPSCGARELLPVSAGGKRQVRRFDMIKRCRVAGPRPLRWLAIRLECQLRETIGQLPPATARPRHDVGLAPR